MAAQATTKKYQLDPNKYVWIALRNLIKKEWWYGLAPLALIVAGIFYAPGRWWMIITGIVVVIGYLLFWMIQFYGLTQHEMSKMMFYKVTYEINGKHLMMKVDAKHGMPVNWNQFKTASKTKNGYILTISKAQFFYLPFEIFKSDNDIRFTEALLRTKKLI